MSTSTLVGVAWLEVVVIALFIVGCLYAGYKLIFDKQADKVFLGHLVLGYFYLALAPAAYIFVIMFYPFFSFGYQNLAVVFGLVFSILIVYKAIFTFAKGHRVEKVGAQKIPDVKLENAPAPQSNEPKVIHHLFTFLMIPFVMIVSFLISAGVVQNVDGQAGGGWGIIVVWPPVFIIFLVGWFVWRYRKK